MSLVGRPGFKETEVGWIPEDWQPSTLGSAAHINPNRTKPDSVDDEVSFLAMGDVSEDGRVMARQVRVYKDVAKGFTSFIDDDVLVAKITPCFENGKGALVTNLLGGIGLGSTEFHVVRARPDRATPAFLNLHTRSDAFRRLGERNMVGSVGQKRVPAEFLREYPIALPPLTEQQEIADILSAVEDKLNVIARQIDVFRSLKQGLMQTLFSRGVGTQGASGEWVPHAEFKRISSQSVPVLWNARRLGEIAPLIRRPVEVDPDATYPELGLRSFGKGTFHKPALSGAEVGNKRLFQIRAGDLLFSNVFAWEGAVAVARPEDDGRYGSHRYITCVVDATQADTNFLFRYLTTPAGIASLTLASPGGAGRNKTLGLGALADIVVPLPPLSEQREISQILDSVDAKLNLLDSKREACNALKRGLMQKLLTGEWRVSVDTSAAGA